MSALIQPTKGNYWSIYDKELHTTVFTLTETGDVHAWRAYKVEHTILVFPTIDDATAWLIEARNRHPQLTRANGWSLEWWAGQHKTTGEIMARVWFEQLPQNPLDGGDFIGPLLDLDVALRRYFSHIDLPEKAPST